MEREKINSECEFDGLKDNRLSYKCRECREIRYDSINGLIKKFPSVYQFCNSDLNKFILLLRKGVYPYEYMDSWEKFDETTLPPNEVSHSTLNLEDISNEDYTHAQKVWDAFEIKNLGEYHDSSLKVIRYCLQMCLKILEISVLKYMNLILYILYLNQD